MTAAEVLALARERGLTLSAHPQGLYYQPKDKLTPDLRELLLAHKPALLELLRGETCASGTPGCSWPWAWRIKGQPWRCAWCDAYSADLALRVDVPIEWLAIRETPEALPIPPPPEERRKQAQERRQSA